MNDAQTNFLKKKAERLKQGANKANEAKANPLDAIKKAKEKDKELLKSIEESQQNQNLVQLIAISDIVELSVDGVSMHNRTAFSIKEQGELEKFAQSLLVAEKDKAGLYQTGLINAITVRRGKDNTYERIAGDRRVRAFKLNKKTHIPAIIIECDDKIARRLRNVENNQRRELNTYDKVLGQLEEIQLYCDYSSLDETEKILRDTKRKITKNNKNNIEHDETTQTLIALVADVSDKTLGTFINRLEVLKVNKLIKELMQQDLISITEAIEMKRALKDDEELIRISLEYLESLENRPSKNEFKQYLSSLVENIKGIETNKRKIKPNKLTDIKQGVESIKSKNIEALSKENKEKALNILVEIQKKIDELNILTN